MLLDLKGRSGLAKVGGSAVRHDMSAAKAVPARVPLAVIGRRLPQPVASRCRLQVTVLLVFVVQRHGISLRSVN